MVRNFNEIKNVLTFNKDNVFRILLKMRFVVIGSQRFLQLYFIGPIGYQFMFISLKIFQKSSFLNNPCIIRNFYIRRDSLFFLINGLNLTLFGICCGYFNRFVTIGYNYRIKSSFAHSYLFIFLGHRYSLALKFPDSVRIFRKKRSFTIFGTNFIEFNFIVDYVRHLRDLFPYKNRGFLIRKEVVSLKRGKKVKFK